MIRMSKLNKFSSFVESINEQAVDLKTMTFASLLSMFESLIEKKSTNPADETQLNSVRGEILDRYAKTGATP